MTKGIKEKFVQSLVDAGFRKPEANSLTSTWNNSIRMVMLGLFSDITTAIKQEHALGAQLTNEITIETINQVRQLFQTHR